MAESLSRPPGSHTGQWRDQTCLGFPLPREPRQDSSVSGPPFLTCGMGAVWSLWGSVRKDESVVSRAGSMITSVQVPAGSLDEGARRPSRFAGEQANAHHEDQEAGFTHGEAEAQRMSGLWPNVVCPLALRYTVLRNTYLVIHIIK